MHPAELLALASAMAIMLSWVFAGIVALLYLRIAEQSVPDPFLRRLYLSWVLCVVVLACVVAYIVQRVGG